MSGNRQMEIHYIDTGFPYTVTESFMDLFEGLTYAQSSVGLSDPFHDQNNPYWSVMHANTYKYGFSGAESNFYYNFDHAYDLNEYTHRVDEGRRVWDNPTTPLTNLGSPHGGQGHSPNSNSSSEERIRGTPSSSSPQVTWQDNIDPDTMTYEELLDLGEAVGTQNRGMSKECISMLPVSKFKCSFFPKKKSRRERCVICQMDYKRGDRQMTLPCKHIYHVGCVTRWLSINKVCPVCFCEVTPQEPKKN
ncbi:RING/U-box superfamily protein [Carex rostrata]